MSKDRIWEQQFSKWRPRHTLKIPPAPQFAYAKCGCRKSDMINPCLEKCAVRRQSLLKNTVCIMHKIGNNQ